MKNVEDIIDISQLPLLKNGKPHVSYSEVSTHQLCPWSHKLTYIDKLVKDEDSPYLDYGTILHDTIEKYLSTREMNEASALDKIREVWNAKGFDSKEFIEKMTAKAASQGWTYKHAKLDVWLMSATNCLIQLPEFLEKNFPGWVSVSAEELIYAKFDDNVPGYFKGFVDSIIKLPNGKHVIIDWKTAGPRGWSREKKQSFLTIAQIVLYKSFWMRKTGLKSNQISTCFVLLKRESKAGKSVELFKVSAGPTTLEKANKMVLNMLKNMNAGFAIKNRSSCKFYQFFETQHCT